MADTTRRALELLVVARAWPDDHRRPDGELGARVDITVVPGPRGPTLGSESPGAAPEGDRVPGRGDLGGRCARRRRIDDWPWRRSRLLPTTVLPNTVLRLTYLRPTGEAAPHHGRAATPPASAYPLRCLSLLIAMHDPSLMSAAFDRNLPCGRPRGPNTLIAVGAARSGGIRSLEFDGIAGDAECLVASWSPLRWWHAYWRCRSGTLRRPARRAGQFNGFRFHRPL